jgi:hypothetical protein
MDIGGSVSPLLLLLLLLLLLVLSSGVFCWSACVGCWPPRSALCTHCSMS